MWKLCKWKKTIRYRSGWKRDGIARNSCSQFSKVCSNISRNAILLLLSSVCSNCVLVFVFAHLYRVSPHSLYSHSYDFKKNIYSKTIYRYICFSCLASSHHFSHDLCLPLFWLLLLFIFLIVFQLSTSYPSPPYSQFLSPSCPFLLSLLSILLSRSSKEALSLVVFISSCPFTRTALPIRLPSRMWLSHSKIETIRQYARHPLTSIHTTHRDTSKIRETEQNKRKRHWIQSKSVKSFHIFLL